MAVVDALRRLQSAEGWDKLPVHDWLAAVSVGVVDGEILLDLNYEEDSQAEVDMNVVMTGDGSVVEIQGTAEGRPFSQEQMHRLFDRASVGIAALIEHQQRLLGPLALSSSVGEEG